MKERKRKEGKKEMKTLLLLYSRLLC